MWRVFAVFSRAIYLADADENVRVLIDHRSPRGPLHLRVRNLPDLGVGDEVLIEADTLSFEGGQVPLEEPWVGRRVSGLDPLDQPMRLDRLRHLAREIGGRGPGLTPEGDDFLAGVMMAHWHQDPSTEPELLRIARSVDTNRIASAFLIEAAVGQCIEPAHRLLEALAMDDKDAVLNATDELAKYGASSGAALAKGIELGTQESATLT